jgi:hypothetical protein
MFVGRRMFLPRTHLKNAYGIQCCVADRLKMLTEESELKLKVI